MLRGRSWCDDWQARVRCDDRIDDLRWSRDRGCEIEPASCSSRGSFRRASTSRNLTSASVWTSLRAYEVHIVRMHAHARVSHRHRPRCDDLCKVLRVFLGDMSVIKLTVIVWLAANKFTALHAPLIARETKINAVSCLAINKKKEVNTHPRHPVHSSLTSQVV